MHKSVKMIKAFSLCCPPPPLPALLLQHEADCMNLHLFVLEIPFLALTGTTNEKMRNSILKDLAMKKTVVINISPDRDNNRLTIMKAKRKYHLTHLQWLVDLIKTERGKTTKTVVFCTTMHDVARVSAHC